MKAVLLTGAGVAVADGVVLGVALGVGSTAVALTALGVGLASAVVLGWLTPTAPVDEDVLVTLGTRATPESSAEQVPDEQPLAVIAPAAAPDVETAPVPRHALVTPAAA